MLKSILFDLIFTYFIFIFFLYVGSLLNIWLTAQFLLRCCANQHVSYQYSICNTRAANRPMKSAGPTCSAKVALFCCLFYFSVLLSPLQYGCMGLFGPIILDSILVCLSSLCSSFLIGTFQKN